MSKKNRKIFLALSLLAALSMYYLGVGIFFFIISSAYFILRLTAIVAPAVILAATLAVMVQRVVKLKRGRV